MTLTHIVKFGKAKMKLTLKFKDQKYCWCNTIKKLQKNLFKEFQHNWTEDQILIPLSFIFPCTCVAHFFLHYT